MKSKKYQLLNWSKSKYSNINANYYVLLLRELNTAEVIAKVCFILKRLKDNYEINRELINFIENNTPVQIDDDYIYIRGESYFYTYNGNYNTQLKSEIKILLRKWSLKELLNGK